MSYQAVLFDIDGTLIDSFPPYRSVMLRTLAKYNKTASSEDLKETFSMSLSQAFNFLGIPGPLQGSFERDYLKYASIMNLKPSLFSGIKTMFEGLNKHWLPGIGIVTSGGNEEVATLAKNFKFMRHVWTTVTADTIPYHKPAPEPLLHAVDQMGIGTNKALYIGDALVDMEAARNAKMDFGIAGWGADPKIHFSKYKYRFKRPQDILKLF